ncbi:hypothetical protein PYCC9005_004580 [Savitreella phatthalungensis]
MEKRSTEQIICSWLLPLVKSAIQKPFFVGLSGIQGSGKSTLVRKLQSALIASGVQTVQLSLDDVYLTHDDQVKLARNNQENRLLSTRGQFGTHDLELARDTLQRLQTGELPIQLPSYDKSAFDGAGDRATPEQWPRIEHAPECVIFEGWGVGFRPLDDSALSRIWDCMDDSNQYRRTLRYAPQSVRQINQNLRDYMKGVMGPDAPLQALIALIPQSIEDVYQWREQQEQELRAHSPAMSPEQVIAFVDHYYPSYELYFDQMRNGFFTKGDGSRQLNLFIDHDRDLIGYEVI